MPVLERNFLIRCTSSNEWIVVRKSYSHDVALFLIVDSERRFLFERRIRPGDPLFGQIVIKARKAKDPGECKFPLWAACRECLEEVNTYAEITAPPPNPLFDEQQNNMLYPFLMTGALWGGVENREPDKSELVWLSAGQVYSQNGGRVEINPIFQLETTRQILLDARIKMDKLGL